MHSPVKFELKNAAAARVAQAINNFYSTRLPREPSTSNQVRITWDDNTNTVYVPPAGALMVIWGAFQYSQRQECMNCFIGGGLMMAIGGVIALVSYLASGRAVGVDRTLN